MNEACKSNLSLENQVIHFTYVPLCYISQKKLMKLVKIKKKQGHKNKILKQNNMA